MQESNGRADTIEVLPCDDYSEGEPLRIFTKRPEKAIGCRQISTAGNHVYSAAAITSSETHKRLKDAIDRRSKDLLIDRIQESLDGEMNHSEYQRKKKRNGYGDSEASEGETFDQQAHLHQSISQTLV